MSATPMAYSTANWHWKNKTVTPWARQWFERELVTIQVEGSDGAVVSVERVVEVDGDVELGRRKSKYVRALSDLSGLALQCAKRNFRPSCDGVFLFTRDARR
jgi:activator of HSP90 ATPase